jgi:hypothetical protein
MLDPQVQDLLAAAGGQCASLGGPSMSTDWGLAPIANSGKRCDAGLMHKIQPNNRAWTPKQPTFFVRHRVCGASAILPYSGLLLSVVAIALAVTGVSLWWLAVIAAVLVGIVDAFIHSR